MSWRWIWITALLAALVAGIGTFMQRDPAEVSATEAPQQPGYFLSNAIVTQTEADGTIGLRLTAGRIDQRHRDDSIRLTNVRVDYLKTAERHWTITAQQGFVPGGSRVVQLSGDVNLRPLDDPKAAYLRLDALAVDTEKNIAYSTSSPVDIRYGRLAMTVNRFEADLTSERVQLEAVQGRAERQ